MTRPRAGRDLTTVWLGVGFLLLLLGSEGALTLPDADATDASATRFYADHAAVVVALQVVGFVACLLLALFARRLRGLGRAVAATGILLAVLALVPGIVTLLAAVLADPDRVSRAGRLNAIEPWADDLLFVGIGVFALAVLGARSRTPVWVTAIAGLTTVAVLVRLAMDVVGTSNTSFDAIAPVLFLLLVAALTIQAALRRPERAQP